MRKAELVLAIATTAAASSLALACDESPTGPTTRALTFGGVVLDYLTQAPVVGASVNLHRSESETNIVEAVTDASGRYFVTVTGTGRYTARVDSGPSHRLVVNGSQFRGDLFVHSGTCRARYGVVVDAMTLRPIADAIVSLTNRSVRSASDGWYRIDLDCPPMHQFGNTTFLYATKSGYQQAQAVVGRGVQLVQRVDIPMERE